MKCHLDTAIILVERLERASLDAWHTCAAHLCSCSKTILRSQEVVALRSQKATLKLIDSGIEDALVVMSYGCYHTMHARSVFVGNKIEPLAALFFGACRSCATVSHHTSQNPPATVRGALVLDWMALMTPSHSFLAYSYVSSMVPGGGVAVVYSYTYHLSCDVNLHSVDVTLSRYCDQLVASL